MEWSTSPTQLLVVLLPTAATLAMVLRKTASGFVRIMGFGVDQLLIVKVCLICLMISLEHFLTLQFFNVDLSRIRLMEGLPSPPPLLALLPHTAAILATFSSEGAPPLVRMEPGLGMFQHVVGSEKIRLMVHNFILQRSESIVDFKQ